MNKHIKHIVFVLLACLGTLSVRAQTIWPSPEVEQMYRQARQNHSNGNINQAIVLYQQAIKMAPNIVLLHRELAHAYYLTGNYDAAKNTLEPIIKSNDADAQTYQVMATVLDATGDGKKAKNILRKGLNQFPKSGILYNQLGKVYENEGEKVYALETYLDGIEADPQYHVNYYDATHMYMYTNKMVWAILYGEMFLNFEHHTPRANEARKMVLAAYKRLFSSFQTGDIPKYGTKNSKSNDFEQAVYDTYVKHALTVADGFTTENLIMLRTRFIMDWTVKYASRYPFSLFSRQDGLIRNGYFDMYNQWLFGQTENPQQFDAWKKFHPDAMPAMDDWINQNKYQPTTADAYNEKKVDGIFLKLKD